MAAQATWPTRPNQPLQCRIAQGQQRDATDDRGHPFPCLTSAFGQGGGEITKALALQVIDLGEGHHLGRQVTAENSCLQHVYGGRKLAQVLH